MDVSVSTMLFVPAIAAVAMLVGVVTARSGEH